MSADDMTTLTIRIPSSLKDRLQAQASEEGCSTSSFIAYALDTFLTDQDRKNASKLDRPRAVVHFLKERNGGDYELLADGPIDFLVVDERYPRDRVYRLTKCFVEPRKIDDLIGSSVIGDNWHMPGAEGSN